jgi:hypothetical protein
VGVKRPQREISATREVKNGVAIPALPYKSSRRSLDFFIKYAQKQLHIFYIAVRTFPSVIGYAALNKRMRQIVTEEASGTGQQWPSTLLAVLRIATYCNLDFCIL